MRLIPNSNSEDNSPARLRVRLQEFNPCHAPDSGKFAPKGQGNCEGGGAAKPEKKIIRQQFGALVPVHAGTTKALKAIENDASIPAGKPKQKAMYELVKRLQPEVAAEVQKLIDRGGAGMEEFKQSMHTVAKRLGFETHDDIESRAVLEGDTNYVIIGGLKGIERSTVKVAAEYMGDVSQLKDVLRGTVAVRDGDGMVNAISELSKIGEIINIKDNVTKPMTTGYRDINVLVRMKGSGMLAEMQIISKPMLRAKMGLGHKLYTAYRVFSNNPEVPEAKRLEAKQHRLYSRAWKITPGGMGMIGKLGAVLAAIVVAR